MSDAIPTPPAAMIPARRLATVLAEPARWKILRELAKGEALPVAELARRAGSRPNMTSKHMAMLREAGLAVITYGRLYRLAPAVRVRPEERVLDLGHLLLRLDTGL